MNKRNRKMKEFPRRLIAWLLCCICLLGAVPISAVALEADVIPVMEETAIVESSEESTVISEETTVISEETTVISEETTVEIETTIQSEPTAEPGTISEVETEIITEFMTEPTQEVETPVSQSLYDKVTAAQSCEEIFKLFQSEEKADEVLLLSVEELTSIQDQVNNMEDDGWKSDLQEAIDMLVAIANGEGDGKETDVLTTFKITNIISNATVAYVKCTSASDADNVNLVPVENGREVNESATSGVLIFFVKPADGYLLTQYKNSNGTACDLYGISIPAGDSNIGWFNENPVAAQKIINKANAEGYVGYYAFTYAQDSRTYSASYTVEGQKPEMTVAASANPNEDLKPGDKVTFTVTIIPGDLPAVEEEVTEVRITSLKINGTEYIATKNDDGTYSVEYEITETDWKNQKAHLDVEAELDYEYVVGVNDRVNVSSYIPTKATITGNASTDCTFASKQGVVYQVKFDPNDKVDISRFPTTPVDSEEYFNGDTVAVDTEYNKASVDDPVNKGTWTFDGWYYGDQKVGETLIMGDSNILLVGTWIFTSYPNADLNICKTVSGNMQDPEKKFKFTITADKTMSYNGMDNTEFTFELAKDEKVTISVPVGANVTVSEDPSGYIYSVDTKETTIRNYTALSSDDKDQKGITFAMPKEESTVVFNNEKNITIDTGIFQDTLPYIIILVVVVFGVAVVLMKQLRNRNYE